MSHLYIHIPFCLSKCSYCSYSSYPGMAALYERYKEALKTEIRLVAERFHLDPLVTLFFGGGTPSLLDPGDIADLLDECREWFKIDERAEISLETNPKTVNLIKLLAYIDAGINRISVGVQSFSDSELQCLGRLHSAQQAVEAVLLVRQAGISNINIDLISALPAQTPESWRWNLQSAIALNPAHLSLYQLSIEENTRFFELKRAGNLYLPDDEAIEQMDEITDALCAEAGYFQYEISNYTKAGYACRHNVNYWENGAYAGVGAGAVSYIGGVRIKNITNPIRYCESLENGKSVVGEREELCPEDSFRETVVLGLRMVRGVSVQELLRRYGIDLRTYYGGVMDKLLDEQLAKFDGDDFRLTRKGRTFANQVMTELV